MFQVENLRFRYPKNTTDTLEELEFTIKRGEIFGLLGPSGVGKHNSKDPNPIAHRV